VPSLGSHVWHSPGSDRHAVVSFSFPDAQNREEGRGWQRLPIVAKVSPLKALVWYLGELRSPSASDTVSPLLRRTVRAGSRGDQARGLVLENEGAQGR
jgi:hypothetical protein